jgi:hypothetical protein
MRALKGITSWHLNAETQGYLNNTLKDFAGRLSANKEIGTSRLLGEILYGLRGVNGAELSEENQKIVAQVILQVAKRMQLLLEVPRVGAVNAMIHGVSPCFSAQNGALQTSVNALNAVIERRLPEPPTTMTDLGYACATLVALSGHRRQFSKLIDSMWKDVVEKTNLFMMSSNRMNDGDLIAWRVIQQAYGVYERAMPIQLERRLASLHGAVQATDTTSRSEARIADYFRDVPGVSMLHTRYVNGFEIDLAFQVDGNPQRINVEVDGHHHDETVQEYFDRMRDDCLGAQGWKVVRVGTKLTEAEAHQLVAGLRKGL